MVTPIGGVEVMPPSIHARNQRQSIPLAGGRSRHRAGVPWLGLILR